VSNDDIGEDIRLDMFRTQVLIRETEQRVQDLYLQNLVKGATHPMVRLLQHGALTERSFGKQPGSDRPATGKIMGRKQ